MNEVKPASFSRFEVYRPAETTGSNKRVLGSAYLKEGDSMIVLQLWTMMKEKFYVIRSRDNASRYLVMTREENRNAKSNNKFFWHIVGNGTVDTIKGILQLDFDLFDKPIFMSLHPDRKPTLRLAKNQEAS